MSRPLGADVSVWDDDNNTPQGIDFVKMKSRGVKFVYIKASQSMEDEDFKRNWKDAKDAGLLRGAYHYLNVAQSEISQAQLFCGLIKGDLGELPPVCDFEQRLATEPTPAVMASKLWNFLQYVEKDTLRLPMIYTGHFYWEEHGNTDPKWLKYFLWLPWYESESYIKAVTGGTGAPKPWTNWKIWQYSESGDGLYYGVESSGIDLNYYNGTDDELLAWSNSIVGGVTPPQSGNVYYVNVNLVNIRSGPASTYSLVGTAPKGKEFVVYETKTNYSRVGINVWIFSSYLTRK
jgi:lysozyme